jgi:PhzF family phenazine biosynthesis protein
MDPRASAQFFICDVFAERPLAGNSLTVVLHDEPLDQQLMQALTRELRQFETVFVRPTSDPHSFETHVFDLARELDFAGHPLLGAAAVLHDALRDTDHESWLLRINGRDVPVRSHRVGPGALHLSMDQGTPVFGATADSAQAERALAAFSLTIANLAAGVAPAVVSTGLRYLVVPISSGLADARIVHPHLEQLLAELDAEFAYLLDVPTREGRHWENDGSLEDIATGSAAGAVGAFLVSAGLAEANTTIVLRQGRFLGRPSEMHIRVDSHTGETSNIDVSGPVAILAHGVLRLQDRAVGTDSKKGGVLG